MLKDLIKKSAVSLMAASLILTSGFTVFAEAPSGEGAPTTTTEAEAPKLENDSTYKVHAVFRKHGSTSKSMAGDVLAKDAEIIVDSSGKATAVLNFVPAQIMGLNVHATGFKLYEPGTRNLLDNSSFVLSEDNTAICKLPLTAIPANGIFEGKVFSSIMDSDVDLYLDWSTLKKENDLADKLQDTINKAKELKAEDFTPETYAELDKAIKAGEALLAMPNPENSQLQEKEAAINNAKNKLVRVMANPFTSPSTTYYLDVADEDNVGSFAIITEAVVKTDAKGVPTVTVKFKKYTDFLGDYIINEMSILGRNGAPLKTQEYKVDRDGNGELIFVMDFFPPNGRYKATVTASNAPEKTHDIVFDWATIRTTADFRPLNAMIEKASEIDPATYTESTMAKLNKALEKAKAIAADSQSPQATINDATKELSDAYDGLLIVENYGKANSANIGTSGFNKPFAGGNAADAKKPWAGSRIHFGKNNMVWRVLDSENNLIMLDSDPIEVKFTENFMSTHWDNSTVREKLNGEFFNNSFTDAEKNIILDTDLETVYMDTSKPEGQQEHKTVTKDKVFILTLNDLKNPEYGFHNDASRKASISYWTRNRVGLEFFNMVAAISYLGSPLDTGMIGTVEGFGALPALRLDENSVFMTTVAGSKLPETLEKTMASKENDWQLTLKTDSAKAEVKDVTWNGKTLKGIFTTDFDGATPTVGILRGNMIPASRAALPVDLGISYYGKLNPKDDGAFAINLPADFDPTKDVIFFTAEKDMEESMGRIAADSAVLSWDDVKKVDPPKEDPKMDNPMDNKTDTASAKVIKKAAIEKLSAPKTGDSQMVTVLSVALIAAAISLIATTLLKKKLR